MDLGFKLKDVMHRITVKFYPASLPDARKPYILRAVYQPELDVHAVASKAEIYNISINPEIIEEGVTAFLQLITYLAADGYQIKTPVFTLKVNIPGEYDGTETHLPENTRPKGHINLSNEMQKYLHEHIQLQFLGKKDTNGFIGEVIDRMTGGVNETIHPGKLFEITGAGLKITADATHADDVGIYLESAADGTRVRIDPLSIGLNERTRLAASAPNATEIPTGSQWYMIVRTQETAKEHGGQILKHVREMKSNFTLTVL
jgi:hypothetical protein